MQKYRLIIRLRKRQSSLDDAESEQAGEANLAEISFKIGIALKLIQEQYPTANLNLDRISKQLNISIWHFARLFKQETSISFKKYLKAVRMNQAGDLLTDTLLSIKQVAAAVGYNHVSDFDHHFRDFYGMTPTNYRIRSQPIDIVCEQESPTDSKNAQEIVIDINGNKNDNGAASPTVDSKEEN